MRVATRGGMSVARSTLQALFMRPTVAVAASQSPSRAFSRIPQALVERNASSGGVGASSASVGTARASASTSPSEAV